MKPETFKTTQTENNNHSHASTPTYVYCPKELDKKFFNKYGMPLTATSLYRAICSLRSSDKDLLLKRVQKYDGSYFVRQLDISPKKSKKKKAIRKNPETETFLKLHMCKDGEKDSFSTMFTNMVGFLCYIKENPTQQKDETTTGQIVPLSSPVLSVHGNKEWAIEEYIPIFEQLPDSIDTCVDLFGGSGILTSLASTYGLNCIYNDDDKDKQNFFKCLINKPSELRIKCIYYIANPDAQLPPRASALDKAGLFWANSYIKNKFKKSRKT